MADPNDTQSSDSKPEWFADGLRFQCTQCGNCCTGPPGVVRFSPAEGVAMAKTLGITLEAFRTLYVRQAGGLPSLREQETEHGFDCIFLDRTTQPGKALCKVYQARPTQCHTWPFWPELLQSQRSWELAKHNTPCPGMSRGKLFDVTEIRIRRDEAAKAEASH